MARGINQVILVGHTTNTPEVKYMPNGNAVANLTIATNETWKDKNTGEQKEKAEFHRVVIFGKLAEIAGQYVKKGSLLYVSGQLQTRKWQDQSGQDRYTTEIVVNMQGTMQMLDRKGDNEQGDYQQAPQQQQRQQAPQITNAHFDNWDDDIDF